MPTVRTPLLEIAYEIGGPDDGAPLILLHGWPDDVRGWRRSAELLQATGWRTITPYLRGCGPTRFLTDKAPRDGRGVALAQDAIDLADALGLRTFVVAGHDWGAQAAYTLAALFPERVTAIAAIALAYQPRGAFKVPPFSQARRFWYQWFVAVDGGASAVRADPKGFARIQWETWSPPGWFDEAEFEATARSFENPDWTAITVHGYRSRWRPEPVDPRYNALRARLAEVETLSTPTLIIQGASDLCDESATSEDLDRYFIGPYRRVLLDGVGHFPPREASEAVAEVIDRNLRGA